MLPVLEQEPNLVEMDLPEEGIVIVGDLHGQAIDLLTIVRKVGVF